MGERCKSKTKDKYTYWRKWENRTLSERPPNVHWHSTSANLQHRSNKEKLYKWPDNFHTNPALFLPVLPLRSLHVYPWLSWPGLHLVFWSTSRTHVARISGSRNQKGWWRSRPGLQWPTLSRTKPMRHPVRIVSQRYTLFRKFPFSRNWFAIAGLVEDVIQH